MIYKNNIQKRKSSWFITFLMSTLLLTMAATASAVDVQQDTTADNIIASIETPTKQTDNVTLYTASLLGLVFLAFILFKLMRGSGGGSSNTNEKTNTAFAARCGSMWNTTTSRNKADGSMEKYLAGGSPAKKYTPPEPAFAARCGPMWNAATSRNKADGSMAKYLAGGSPAKKYTAPEPAFAARCGPMWNAATSRNKADGSMAKYLAGGSPAKKYTSPESAFAARCAPMWLAAAS